MGISWETITNNNYYGGISEMGVDQLSQNSTTWGLTNLLTTVIHHDSWDDPPNTSFLMDPIALPSQEVFGAMI